MIAACWNIWKARNAWVFRNKSPHHLTTAEVSVRDSNSWKNGIINNHTSNVFRPTPHSALPHAPPPRTSSFKVHCDASFVTDSLQAAYGIVISNSEGHVSDGKSGLFNSSSPIAAEARALYEAVSIASSFTTSISVFSDCQSLVLSLTSPKHQWPWECFGLLGSIVNILQSFPQISVSFTPRSLNRKADWVAKSTRLGSLPSDWVSLL
ncbi:hypothetical protein LINPERHAP1_LOCUS26280 [Linum perenne]